MLCNFTMAKTNVHTLCAFGCKEERERKNRTFVVRLIYNGKNIHRFGIENILCICVLLVHLVILLFFHFTAQSGNGKKSIRVTNHEKKTMIKSVNNIVVIRMHLQLVKNDKRKLTLKKPIFNDLI